MSLKGNPFFVPTSRIQWAKAAGYINVGLATELEEAVGADDIDVTPYERFEVRLQQALDKRAMENQAAKDKALQDERRAADQTNRKTTRRMRTA